MNAAGIGFLMLLALVFTILTSPIFWMIVGLAAAAIGVVAYVDYYNKKVWPNKYFASKDFLRQKRKISKYVEDCNALNHHIGELKALQERIQSSSKGSAVLKDSSNFNYKRESWKDDVAGNHVHQCSRTIVTNAKNNPFKYLVKYFNIKQSEETLHEFESMLNDFAAEKRESIFLDSGAKN